MKRIIEIPAIILGGILLLAVLGVAWIVQAAFVKLYPKGDFYE